MEKKKPFSPGWWLALGCLALLAAGTMLTPPDVIAGMRANPKRGKVFYKINCRVCHDGQIKGTKDLSPLSKTMDQWARDFSAGGEVENCTTRVEKKLGTALNDQDLLDIQSYLIEHAADSDQPATCGN